MKSNHFFADIMKYRTILLMLLPATLFFIVFSYVPMVGAILAFKQYSYTGGIFGSAWNGFDNFVFFFQSGDAWSVTRNTMLYNIAFVIVNNVLQIGVAILLSEIAHKWFKKVTQTMMLLPFFISWVVVGAIAYNLLNYEFGLLNSILTPVGMDPIDIYNMPEIWPYLLVIIAAWKVVGYGSVIYLAAIMGIDSEMYEAAEIDGANVLHRIFRITIPSLYPTLIILILLSVGNIFRGDFGMFYNLVGNNGLLFSTTDVIDTYVFRLLMTSNEIGMSAAAGLFQSVLGFITIVSVNYAIRKYNKENALF